MSRRPSNPSNYLSDALTNHSIASMPHDMPQDMPRTDPYNEVPIRNDSHEGMTRNSAAAEMSPYVSYGRLSSVLQVNSQACPEMTRNPGGFPTYYDGSYGASYEDSNGDSYAEPSAGPSYNQTNIQVNILVVNGTSGAESDSEDESEDSSEGYASSVASETIIRRPALPSTSRQPSERHENRSGTSPTLNRSLVPYNACASSRTLPDNRPRHPSRRSSYAPSLQGEIEPGDSVIQVSRALTKTSSKSHHHRASKRSSKDSSKDFSADNINTETALQRMTHHNMPESSSRGSTTSHRRGSHSHSRKASTSSSKGSSHSHSRSTHRRESEGSRSAQSKDTPRYADCITEEPEEDHHRHRHKKHHKKHSKDDYGRHKKKHGSLH
ncbi:hypothetical protein F4824DRAFT_315747 [Ustulina deusta]|nr:hypothetical protein F4824DRAFT_315747 [Ustulina deusta]